ncbi:peptidase S1 [Anaerocolumna cellulosilytica]|uniref:Peptidase S1 n=1 Tax=Anaerocolumna cellulosilytica TaxID=433286 RepID=A0A6S6R994_9FIRM|nr:trypsin-like peptidase domain-containing protein [Anaerocolumna cellulosilytica]MBB5196635.1 serine protease Do [Anaerocolumna cellulosilytica]BCJ95735.1 peptidase S1 [Anaerocolumna cellulosilytica]
MDEFNRFNKEDNKYYDNGAGSKIIEGYAVIKDVESKKKKSVAGYFSKIVITAGVFGLVAGVSFQGYNSIFNKQGSNTEISQNTSEPTSNDTANGVSTVETGISNSTGSDVSTVVNNVMPSIVAINAKINNVTNDFFGRQYNQEVDGSGSGIIIGQNDSEILIATNNHVIKGANAVEIVFADDTTAQATVKGTAPASDLAVVAVDVNDLEEGTFDNIKIATLGDSDSVKLGEMAIAIGNALGYGQSITVGYVSALDREVTVDNITLKVLQTDAAINPGNSGGALLNSKGEVIGINSVKYVDDSVESIGYAIPITDAIPVISDLMNRTELEDSEKAYLGIGGKDVTSSYSQSFNMPVGIYVGEIADDSAAAKAGIVIGDIVVAVNNTKVESLSELQDALNYTKAGSEGTITVKSLVNGSYEEKVLNITFGFKPKN